ncbi:MAG: phosphatase PAP2 family protein [Candidatus Firestonebacteria bacterium]|nr:phosphatase PAP2 family protein [Candidatus Firestonebacteria bacterium]
MEELLKKLINLDVRVFYFLNRDLSNPVLDFIMPIITNEGFILGPIIAVAVYFMIRGSRKTRIALLCMIIAVLFADAVAYRLIKPFFGRLRPCDVLPGVNQLVNAGRFSFPSNHAANMMALATITGFFYKKYFWIVFAIALLEGYSRIYVGVHYPLDVLNGYFLGAISALIVIIIYRRIEYEKKRK